jgi:uncharacterized membrane protein
MAVKQPPVGPMQMPFRAQFTEVTVAPTSLCHYITDEELERLGEMRKEPVMEIFLCAIGAFLGALIPALQNLGQFNSNPSEVDGWGLLTILIAAMMLAVSIVSGALWHQRSKVHTSMVETIRGRPRSPVRLGHDNTA